MFSILFATILNLLFASLESTAFTIDNKSITMKNISRITTRAIEKIVPAKLPPPGKFGPIRLIGSVDIDGAGTQHSLPEVDPFILLDVAVIEKNSMPPFGAHPHRGHSVVTILLNGKVKSWDSFQKVDETDDEESKYRHMISGPASYWVDAGTGVFHDEKSYIEDESDPTQHVKLLQLWVGVSEKDRKNPPRIQYDENLPSMECLGFLNHDDGEVKNSVVVGQMMYYVGPKTTIETPHPITVAHVRQKAGTTYHYPLENVDHGGFVVVLKGKPSFVQNKNAVTPENEYDVLVLENSDTCDDNTRDTKSDVLTVRTSSNEDAEYIVATGERIKEKWSKKLVANGAVIAATPEEAQEFAPKVDAMSKAGLERGGSFAPFGV